MEHSSNSFEMPFLLSAFSNVLPQVICGQPIASSRRSQEQPELVHCLIKHTSPSWCHERRAR